MAGQQWEMFGPVTLGHIRSHGCRAVDFGSTLMLWLAWKRRPLTGTAMLPEALQALLRIASAVE